MTSFEPLITLLGVKMNKPQVLEQAFVHRSFLNESKKEISSNERLEFLGDSILSYLVSDFLYKSFPKLPEGELTNLRSSLVKTQTLAEIALELHLGNYLLLSKGEEETGGRKNPSILADTFEALLGVVYASEGLEAIKKILETHLYSRIEKIVKDRAYKDAKSTFQELVQNETKISPSYKVLKEQGPDHAKQFLVGAFVGEILWGSGKGKSKQEAEQSAAMNALVKWSKK